MSFMEVEVTDKQAWFEVDGPMGKEYIPADLVGDLNLTGRNPVTILNTSRVEIPAELRDYCENDSAWTIKRYYGYGVRLSAPGYLDCTSWSVYTNLREAKHAARELEMEDTE